MDAATAWAEAMKFENRANPYPYYEELRKTPVAKVDDRTYVVTGYPEAVALAHDPRISSDMARSARRAPTRRVSARRGARAPRRRSSDTRRRPASRPRRPC
jgi:hypothetical protein